MYVMRRQEVCMSRSWLGGMVVGLRRAALVAYVEISIGWF